MTVERGALLPELRSQLERVDNAIGKVSHVRENLAEILAKKYLSQLSGFDYLEKAANLPERVGQIQQQIDERTIPTLSLHKEQLKSSIETAEKAEDLLRKIQQGVEEGRIPTSVYEQAVREFANLLNPPKSAETASNLQEQDAVQPDEVKQPKIVDRDESRSALLEPDTEEEELTSNEADDDFKAATYKEKTKRLPTVIIDLDTKTVQSEHSIDAIRGNLDWILFLFLAENQGKEVTQKTLEALARKTGAGGKDVRNSMIYLMRVFKTETHGKDNSLIKRSGHGKKLKYKLNASIQFNEKPQAEQVALTVRKPESPHVDKTEPTNLPPSNDSGKETEIILPTSIANPPVITVARSDAQKNVLARLSQISSVFRAIVDTVPESVLMELAEIQSENLPVTRQEIHDLASLVAAYQSGSVQIPGFGDFLQAPGDDQKHKLASRTLRGLIATTIIRQSEVQPKTASLKHRLGLAVNQLTFLLGSTEARDIICRELESLPSFERTLMYQSMSTNIKRELDYPDIDECDASQMGEYIVGAAYIDWGQGETPKQARVRTHEESYRRLAELITASVERDHSGVYAGKVINILLEKGYYDHMFKRMAAGALETETLDVTESFFQSHSETVRYATICNDILRGDDSSFDLEDLIAQAEKSN